MARMAVMAKMGEIKIAIQILIENWILRQIQTNQIRLRTQQMSRNKNSEKNSNSINGQTDFETTRDIVWEILSPNIRIVLNFTKISTRVWRHIRTSIQMTIIKNSLREKMMRSRKNKKHRKRRRFSFKKPRAVNWLKNPRKVGMIVLWRSRQAEIHSIASVKSVVVIQLIRKCQIVH